MSEGWIRLHRSLLEHEIWQGEPFTRGQAWVDLLMLANHKSKSIRVRGIVLTVQRGQVGWSEVKLSERWGWSRNKVRRFLKELEKAKQIEQQKNNLSSLIHIVNYESYQANETANETAERQQKDTNKNVKNEKKKEEPKILSGKPDETPPYKEIISYLNEKIGTKYLPSSEATKTRIRARWNEGFRLDDFKRVIDNKAADWQHDPKMCTYLRPDTLFGRKFESYLNQSEIVDRDDRDWDAIFNGGAA